MNLDRLQAGDIPELPCDVHVQRFVPKEMITGIRQGAGMGMATGWMNFQNDDDTLNHRHPDIEPMSVKHFFSKYVVEEDQTAHYG